MPEELRFETEDGQERNEIIFKRTIKGIPSLITTFYLKNISESVSCRGHLNVTPTFGRSFSEDLTISDSGEFFSRRVEFDLPPLERQEFKARVIPITTPSGVSGRASVKISGEWY